MCGIEHNLKANQETTGRVREVLCGFIILDACYLISVCVPSIRRDRWRWYNYITRDLGHCFAESQETTRVTSLVADNMKIQILIRSESKLKFFKGRIK